MTDKTTDTILRTREITRPVSFALAPDAGTRAALAESLGITSIRKLTFEGEIAPDTGEDLRLDATLGATVVQPCVVTFDPVTTRIDEEVTRTFLAEMPPLPEGDEIEMPEDDTLEPLPREIDLAAIMSEALSLALPQFPRAQGVDPVDMAVTEPGKTPMSDEEVKPFASLKTLRDRMGGGNGENGDENT